MATKSGRLQRTLRRPPLVATPSMNDLVSDLGRSIRREDSACTSWPLQNIGITEFLYLRQIGEVSIFLAGSENISLQVVTISHMSLQ